MCNINNYEFYKSHHICVRCGQEDAERNNTLCFRCRIKNRESSINYYNSHKEERKEKNRISSQVRYNRLKNLGLCTCCGKRKTNHNRIMCNHCRAKVNARHRRRYLLMVYATRNLSDIRI